MFLLDKTHYICSVVMNRQMRVKVKSTVIIAWMLFMTLVPFFVAKAYPSISEPCCTGYDSMISACKSIVQS